MLIAVLICALPSTRPPPSRAVEHKAIAKNAKSVLLTFDRRDLVEVIQFVSELTQRNFIIPERISGKITILSNAPIPADEVWDVFVAALDANNWAVYRVGRYWKITEKKQSSRAAIPMYLPNGEEVPATEQMVTKLFKLRFVEADQMRNVLSQFTSRDADIQISPPDTLIVSDLGANVRRLEMLIDQLDRLGGSHEMHVVAVQHASAPDVAQKLSEALQAQIGPKAAGQPVASAKIIPDERTNKLIVIAGEKSFQSVQELLGQLDVPTGDSGVHVYYLKNAKAEEVASTLQSLAQGGGGKRRAPGITPAAPPSAPVPVAGPSSATTPAATAELFSGDVKITADKNTNSLVIIGSQADYRNIVKVIERLDVARRQVFVEAVIMEVNLEDDVDVGASMHAGEQKGVSNGTAVGAVGTELGGLSSLSGISSLASLNGLLAGIQGPPITISGVSIPSFGLVLQALQRSSKVNVISTPHVTMTDNTEGEIIVGQNVPFQAAYSPSVATSSTTATTVASLAGISSLYAPIQRQNVELRLHIKPQITQGDSIRLDIDEQTEEIASVDKQLGPTTSKRSAKTTVVAKDQETIVIGGLIQERKTRSVSKVPVLGSLPILGWFFRSESTKTQKTNLLLFLTPYIVRNQSDLRKIFEKKMKEREEFVRRFSGNDEERRRQIDYDHKPGMLLRLHRGVAEEMQKIENGGPGAPDERVIEHPPDPP